GEEIAFFPQDLLPKNSFLKNLLPLKTSFLQKPPSPKSFFPKASFQGLLSKGFFFAKIKSRHLRRQSEGAIQFRHDLRRVCADHERPPGLAGRPSGEAHNGNAPFTR